MFFMHVPPLSWRGLKWRLATNCIVIIRVVFAVVVVFRVVVGIKES